MATDICSITVTGRLVRAPERKDTGPTKFSIACERSWKDKAGEWQKQTSFFDVVSWSKQGFVGDKSDPVFVAGRIEQETWEDKQTGQKRSRVVIVAEVARKLEREPSRAQTQREPGDESGNGGF